ncbi:MAG: hypothetical protein ACRDF4_11465 [Rhabdochlamydiaceae bacterium]
MFRNKEEIGKLIELFTRRGVYLFHACQFRDFQAYLLLNGIPSRETLEGSKLLYTLFESDDNDQLNGVWDKVFINLEDYGNTFASGKNAVPNPYGPILFKISPASLINADEVTITLRSAGAKDFNRWNEALTSIEEIDRVFYYSIDAKGCDLARVRFGDNLRKVFPDKPYEHIRSTEMHCIFPEELLPLKYVEKIIVDPYIIRDKRLINWVDEEQRAQKISIELCLRIVNGQPRISKNDYNELSDIIINFSPSFDSLVQNSSPVLQKWAQSILNIDWQYERFARYLLEGTLRPLLEIEDRSQFMKH